MFSRILVPLDGSPRAEVILPQLGRVLRHEDAEILLLRVVDLPRAPVSADEMRRERAEAQKYLHDVARRFAGRGAKVHARIVAGPPAEAILQAADDEEATLIAMATHGRTGIARFAFGSVAEKVLRASHVPVLVVRSFRPARKGDFEPMPPEELPFRKILVPVDGPPSAAAIRPAVKFAQLFNAKGVFLHVVPPFEAHEAAPPDSARDPATSQAARRFAAVDLKSVRRTVVGDPASAILDQARSAGVDLIAMGTHGRSGLSRWAMGSVAEKVLRAAPVPMLLVRGR